MKTIVALYALASLSLWPLLCYSQTPLSLYEAVNYALSHRPELRADDARVIGSEKLRTQAGLIPNPHFIFRKEDLRPQTSPFGENSQTYWEGEQLLEISGKRGGRMADQYRLMFHSAAFQERMANAYRHQQGQIEAERQMRAEQRKERAKRSLLHR